MTWIVVVIATVMLAALVAQFAPGWRRARVKLPVYVHFRCPCCRRRLRYLPHQAGHRGACPTCHRGLTFPLAARPVS